MNGVLNIYKEQDFTSHDVVAKLRGICHMKKIGHTGTLDPKAEGVLLVCLGNATKLCDLLTDKSKQYEAVMRLGEESDTQDAFGTVLSKKEVTVTENEVREAVLSFVGEYDQLPPMYSALKVDGKKLYELAREGKVVERKSRRVQIDEIEILSMELPRIRMRVSCSKGTYIRTLCHDIGQKLGTGALMEALLRTRVGTYRVENALRLSEVEKLMKEGKLEEQLVKTEDVFADCEKIVVSGKLENLVHNGNQFPIKSIVYGACQDELVRVYDSTERFIGLYQCDLNAKQYKPYKMFMN